ncbi:glycine cleavage system H-protein subunit [Microsporum ferrugineum]
MAASAVRFVAPLRSALSVPRFRASSALRYAAQPNVRRAFSQSSLPTVGITDYAAKALGDVVYVELPAVEDEVASGDTIGAVESVKSASDIMSPATGKVIEVNTVLEEKPKTVNDSPEGDGWFAKIEITDSSELNELMDAEAYKASLENTD